MKVSELIVELQRVLATAGDLDVLCTWEGIERNVTRDHVYVGYDYPYVWDKREPMQALYIDGDDCRYKQKNMSNAR